MPITMSAMKDSQLEHPSVAEMFYAARNVVKPGLAVSPYLNGQQAFNDRQHSDFITNMPSVYREAPWIEIESQS